LVNDGHFLHFQVLDDIIAELHNLHFELVVPVDADGILRRIENGASGNRSQ
jgi:hypothetical protein